MNFTLYVIQEQIKGIVQEPVVFQKHIAANHYYLHCVKDQYNADVKSFNEALEYHGENKGKDYGIEFWTLEAK